MIYDILPVKNHQGNNLASEFDFDFYVDDASQITVNYFDKNKIKKTLVQGVDYSVEEIQNKNGGHIVFPLESSKYDVLKEGETLSIELALPISQEVQYNNSSLLNLETLEYSFDYITRLIQIVARKLSLCLKIEECDDVTLNELIDKINSNADLAMECLQKVEQLSDKSNENLIAVQNIKTAIDLNKEKFDKISTLEEDVNFLLEEVETKADLENNLSLSDKQQIISWNVPSYENMSSRPNGTYSENVDGVLLCNVINSSNGTGFWTIVIGGKTFNFMQGSSGTDYVHPTNGYFPIPKGVSYSLNASGSVEILFVPFEGEILND